MENLQTPDIKSLADIHVFGKPSQDPLRTMLSKPSTSETWIPLIVNSRQYCSNSTQPIQRQADTDLAHADSTHVS